MTYMVHVIYIVNGTICNDTYVCSHAAITMAGAIGERGTIITFTDGRDDEGSVDAVMYRHAEKITKRTVE